MSTELNFSKNTSKVFLYSNAPEEINSNSKRYTVEKVLFPSTTYEFEMYHHQSQGYGTIRFALVLKNMGNTDASITVEAAVMGVAAGSNAQPSDPTTYMCANVISRYLTGEGARVISLPAQQTCFVSCCDVNSSYYVSGKFRIRTIHPNVVARIAHADVTASSDNFFATDCIKDSASGYTQFSGEVGYCELSADVNVEDAPSFNLCEYISGTTTWPSTGKCTGYINNNEYQASSSYVNGGKNFHAGNYGILYSISLNHAGGKTMYISSPENYVANPYQNLLLYLNGIWQEVRFDASPKAFQLTNAHLQTIKVYHPGGNFSNYHFSFA